MTCRCGKLLLANLLLFAPLTSSSPAATVFRRQYVLHLSRRHNDDKVRTFLQHCALQPQNLQPVQVVHEFRGGRSCGDARRRVNGSSGDHEGLFVFVLFLFNFLNDFLTFSALLL
jgi:hypothetical protein